MGVVHRRVETASGYSRTVERIVDGGLALVALLPIVAVARIFLARLSYPVDLEWCEGGSAYMAWRLLHHLPIYTRPGDVFAPFPYPPAHTLALAAAGWLAGGLDYGPARAVSVLSFALLSVTLLVVVRRHLTPRGGGTAAGLAAVAFVACSFPDVGGWYDLIRVDTMMIALCVLAAALASEPEMGWGRTVTASLAMTAAIFTKQTSAFFAGWICLFALVRHWREGVRLSCTALAFCGVALALLLQQTRGRAWFWIFQNLASHPLATGELRHGLQIVSGFAPFVVALPVAFTLLAATRRASAATWLWFGMLVVAVPAALLPYAKHGGWKNDMIPMVVLLVPATIAIAGDIARLNWRGAGATRVAAPVAAALFILLHPVHAGAFIPDQKAWQTASNLNAFAASLDRGLVVPQMAFLPARNGQTNPHWHRMGHADLEWSHHQVDEDWAVERTQARYALINQLDRSDFGRAIRRQFRLVGQMPDDRRVKMFTGGGVVDLDQLWERLPAPGSLPAGH